MENPTTPAKRGRKPGTPRTGGRKPGTPNKATADVRALAGQYSAEAIDMLFRIACESSSDPARVAALNSLLDRAHGKPAQSLDINGSLEISHEERLARLAAGPDEPEGSDGSSRPGPPVH